MLKKDITFEDLETGQPRTETWYFSLNKAELVEMEVTADGGYEEAMNRIVASKDGKAIMAEFKRFILASVGEKTESGGFRKNEEIRDRFYESPAYSELFMELVTDADAGARFLGAIVPPQLGNKLAEVRNQRARQEAQQNVQAETGRVYAPSARGLAAQAYPQPAADLTQTREEYLAGLVPAEPAPVSVEPVIERNVFEEHPVQATTDDIVEDPQETFRRGLRRDAREQLGLDITDDSETYGG